MTDALGPMRPLIVAQTPMLRMGDAEQSVGRGIPRVDEAKFVTGQVLSPNGGWYMSQ